MQVEPELAGHDSAQVQKIVDELNLRARVAVDDFDGPLLLVGSLGRRASEQHLRPAQDCAQRRAQFVRERRQEFVLESGCALRGHARAALGVQHLFALLIGKLHGLDPLGLGQVAGELGVAEELAGVVAQRSDRDIGPKRRAILAQAPAGIDEAALFRGDLQLVLGPSAVSRILSDKRSKSAAR